MATFCSFYFTLAFFSKVQSLRCKMAGLSPVNIFEASWSPFSCQSSQALIKPKVLFPYHYGQTDVSALPSQLQAEGIDVRIRHYE